MLVCACARVCMRVRVRVCVCVSLIYLSLYDRSHSVGVHFSNYICTQSRSLAPALQLEPTSAAKSL